MTVDWKEQQNINERASQLKEATDREELGLSIKHESVATIRKVGDSLSLTDDQLQYLVAELKKCRNNIIYFAEKYFRIIGDGGLQVIKLYPKQKEMLLAMQRERRLIVLAPRQVGKSTTYSIYFLWQAMFFPDKRIAIAADAAAKAREILSRIKLAYEYLPKEIKPAVTAYNSDTLAFDNNSEIRAFATGGNTLAGFSFDILALDEFALIRWSVADTFFTTTMPVLSSRTNSKAIIVSTPRGTVKNKYYDLWTAANSNEQFNNKEGWVPFRIDWWDVPGRTEEWRNERIAEMGAEKFRQEFGCEFTTDSSALLVPEEVFHKFRKNLPNFPNPIDVNLSDDPNRPPINAIVWSNYRPGRVYAAGADVSEGTGNDASVLYIMDVTELVEEGAEEKENAGITIVAEISTTGASVPEFASASSKLLKNYNYPVVIVENNGVGAGYVDNLIYTYKVPSDKVFSERKPDGTTRYGIKSSNAIKLEACLFARELLTTEEILFKIPDKLLVEDMPTFIRKATVNSITYNAAGGAHDDHIMAFIWGLYLLHYRHIEKYYMVKGAFKTKFGQTLPKRLENIFEPDDVKEITEQPLYKIIEASLSGRLEALDPALAAALSLRPAEDGDELYYGAAGRGGAITGANFAIVDQTYDDSLIESEYIDIEPVVNIIEKYRGVYYDARQNPQYRR